MPYLGKYSHLDYSQNLNIIKRYIGKKKQFIVEIGNFRWSVVLAERQNNLSLFIKHSMKLRPNLHETVTKSIQRGFVSAIKAIMTEAKSP